LGGLVGCVGPPLWGKKKKIVNCRRRSFNWCPKKQTTHTHPKVVCGGVSPPQKKNHPQPPKNNAPKGGENKYDHKGGPKKKREKKKEKKTD